MANLYSRFATDSKLENDGVWVDMGADLQVKVARFGNPVHEKVMEKLRRPYRNILRSGGQLPEDVQTKLTVQGMAEAILLDWKGVTDASGKDLPHSIDNAVQVLSDLKDFRNEIAFLAMERETFRAQAIEKAAKNSKRGSAGS